MRCRNGASGGSVAEGNPAGELFRQVSGKYPLQRGIIRIQVRSKVDCLLSGFPVKEAATPIIGEILWRNGSAVEVCIEDRLHFRQRIKPCEERSAILTIFEALI